MKVWVIAFVVFSAGFSSCTQPAGKVREPQAIPVVVPSVTPAERKITEVDLTVNGVRSGTVESKIVSLIGKPVRTEKGEHDDCAGGYHRHLIYDGLTVDVLSDERGRKYAVTSMEVTSAKWEIAPNVHIGDPIEKIRGIYGRPLADERNTLFYVTKGNEGLVSFEFENGKLVRAVMTETLC